MLGHFQSATEPRGLPSRKGPTRIAEFGSCMTGGAGGICPSPKAPAGAQVTLQERQQPKPCCIYCSAGSERCCPWQERSRCAVGKAEQGW